jgi:MFS family permease
VSDSRYSPWRLVALGLSAMLVPLGSTMIAVALPSIGLQFNRAPGELTQWLVNSYLLIGIVGQSPAGRLADSWGYRSALRLGQVMMGTGSLLAILFPSFDAVIASRVLMALGGAFMVPTVMAVLRLSVPVERRHRVFGYFAALMGFAAALGPSLGGLLVRHFGWRSIFVMNLPPLLLSVALSWNLFREEAQVKPEARSSFDWAGTLLMSAALVFLVTGLKGRSLLLVPALAAFGVFLWWERRTPGPVVDLTLFARRSFAAGCAMVGLQNLGMYALLFQLPYLLKLLYQWGPDHAGPFMTSFMVAMMGASALGGRIAEKVGVKATCLAGSLMSLGGMLLLSALTAGEDWHRIMGALVLGGAGLGLANGPSQSAALGAIERNQSGLASGVLSTCRYLGGVIGISILGLLLSSPHSAASLFRHRLVTLVFAGSFAVAASVSLLLPGRPATDIPLTPAAAPRRKERLVVEPGPR